jgi:hypothetical protein
MFPFNLLFLGEIYDLEHVIARSDIKSIAADRSYVKHLAVLHKAQQAAKLYR